MSQYFQDENYYEYQLDIETDGDDCSEDDVCEGYNFYYNKLKSLPKLKRKEELQLYQKMIKGDQLAREELIVSQLRMVVEVAKFYINRGILFDDLVQEGNIAMINAIDSYTYKATLGIAAYARQMVHKHLSRCVEERGQTVRIPSYLYDEVNKIKRAKSILQNTLYRNPTYHDIATYLHISVKEVIEICHNAADNLADEGDDNGFRQEYFEYLVDSESLTIVDSVFQSDLQHQLCDVMRNLTPRQAKVLIMRFGLEDGIPKTLEQAGKELDITRERIRQIESKALRKLRHPLNARKLKHFIGYTTHREPYVHPLEGLESIGITGFSIIRNHDNESSIEETNWGFKVDVLPSLPAPIYDRITVVSNIYEVDNYCKSCRRKRPYVSIYSLEDMEYSLYSNHPYNVEFTYFNGWKDNLRFWVMNSSNHPISVALLELKVDNTLTKYFHILGRVEPYHGHFFDVAIDSFIKTGIQHIKAKIEIGDEHYDTICISQELSLNVDWDSRTVTTWIHQAKT